MSTNITKSNNEKLIAVIGATGQQGGGVLPVHSLTLIRQGMASICPSSVIS